MPDFQARATWEGRNLTELTTLWTAYVASTGAIGSACPKIGVGFFHYPSLGQIRGARATSAIHKGERICKVPVGELLSDYTVGNSSLLPVVQWAAAHAAEKVAAPPPSAKLPRAGSLRRRTIDDRSRIVLYALRELSRERSPKMPYLQLIQSHDVTGVPSLWPEASPRFRLLSPLAREMAGRSRTYARMQYDTLVTPSLARFPMPLSEGLGCAGSACSPERLGAVYSWERFQRLFAIVSARDWVLPVDGESRAFLAPQVDLLNFGQVGIRAEYSDKAKGFVAVATQPIAEGTELLFYYGSMCKDAWVNLYGFAPAEAKPCRSKYSTAQRAANARTKPAHPPASG